MTCMKGSLAMLSQSAKSCRHKDDTHTQKWQLCRVPVTCCLVNAINGTGFFPLRIGTTTSFRWGKGGGDDAAASLPKWQPPPPARCSLSTAAKLRRFQIDLRESLLNLAEITDDSLHYASQRVKFQLSVLSIRSEGKRRGRPRRNASTDKTRKEADRLKDPPTSNGEASNSASQDEIIALFKRIQSSISKDGASASRRNLKSQKEKKTGEPIPKFPKQKHVKVPRRDDDVVLPERSKLLLKGETANNTVFYGDAKVVRPVSNFVKRSPIPPPSLAQENSKDVAEEQLQLVMRDKVAEKQSQPVTTDGASALQNLDKLKLSDLKELAKRRGIKGYSKLKKGELSELLKGLSDSTR